MNNCGFSQEKTETLKITNRREANKMEKKASQLHEIIESSRNKAKVLAITSGKGGVGKTNISANLAICLAASGKRVLALDADMSLGNLDVIMDINSRYNISHFIKGRKRIEDIIHIGPEGLSLIFGGSGIEELADINEFQRQRILNELSCLQNDNDIIIIDTAAGISKSVISFCLSADHVLVITTPEASAMTDAYATIKVLVGNNFAGPISILVNMADSVSEGQKVYHQIENVAKRFLNTQVYSGGILLRDERLTHAVRARKPVVLMYPKAGISSSLAALAARLNNRSSVYASDQGFFAKVVNWFC